MPPSESSRAEALFTGVRGRGILRNPFAGSCITSPYWPTNRRRTLAHAGAPNHNV
jgi:hypothetical protein